MTIETCPLCLGDGVTFDGPLPEPYVDCGVHCEARAKCTTCGMWKAPQGRSVPVEAANGYCGWDCPGYAEDPRPGHLFQGELHRMRERTCPECDGEGALT